MIFTSSRARTHIMLSTASAVEAPQLAWLIPLVLAVPFVSIVALAVVLNWGR